MCKIGVVDSGAGGISTLCALLGLMPNEDFIYVSDRSHSPYGDKSADYIWGRIYKITDFLHGEGVKAVVLACNTATSVAVEQLRDLFKDIIFVGVEPALKPAVDELTFGKALILLTQATSKQDKFLALVSKFDKNKIILSPQPRLAPLIENNLSNLNNMQAEVQKLLLPLKTPEIESVVLGCTHYCLIKRHIAQIFDAKIYDGNTGTAIRLYSLLKQNGLLSRKVDGGGIKFITL